MNSILANYGLLPHDLSIVDENVIDPFGIARDLPVCTLYQSILLGPLKLRSGITNVMPDSILSTSFLITFVALRKSLLFTSGPPAPAACKLILKLFWPLFRLLNCNIDIH